MRIWWILNSCVNFYVLSFYDLIGYFPLNEWKCQVSPLWNFWWWCVPLHKFFMEMPSWLLWIFKVGKHHHDSYHEFWAWMISLFCLTNFSWMNVISSWWYFYEFWLQWSIFSTLRFYFNSLNFRSNCLLNFSS